MIWLCKVTLVYLHVYFSYTFHVLAAISKLNIQEMAKLKINEFLAYFSAVLLEKPA